MISLLFVIANVASVVNFVEDIRLLIEDDFRRRKKIFIVISISVAIRDSVSGTAHFLIAEKYKTISQKIP